MDNKPIPLVKLKPNQPLLDQHLQIYSDHPPLPPHPAGAVSSVVLARQHLQVQLSVLRVHLGLPQLSDKLQLLARHPRSTKVLLAVLNRKRDRLVQVQPHLLPKPVSDLRVHFKNLVLAPHLFSVLRALDHRRVLEALPVLVPLLFSEAPRKCLDLPDRPRLPVNERVLVCCVMFTRFEWFAGGFGAAAAQPSTGFGNLASQNTIGFGNLAQQANPGSASMPFSG